jgi:hypothetical protein
MYHEAANILHSTMVSTVVVSFMLAVAKQIVSTVYMKVVEW